MLAPAKINFDLRVLGRRSDGYHELDSTVLFACIGDSLTLTDSPGKLSIAGSFADDIGGDTDNLVMQAARALAQRAGMPIDVGFHLTKNLPAAAGLGGGSSDAATTLLLLAQHWGLNVQRPDLGLIAAGLGADVPVCLLRRPTRMTGIGDITDMLDQAERARFSGMPILLINPRQPASTKQVFSVLAQGCSSELGGIAADLRLRSNDLISPALRVAPAIGDILQSLSVVETATAFGMSGSGPSCFALFDRMADCRSAATRLAADNPAWWIASGRLL